MDVVVTDGVADGFGFRTGGGWDRRRGGGR